LPQGRPREALRTATDAAHRRLHSLPSFDSLMRGSLSRVDYIRLLLRLLGLHGPLDERQGQFDGEPLLAWMRTAPEESRAALLRRDLVVLGLPDQVLSAVPRADALLPMATTPAEFLGCAWVIEGSALGGRVIAKLLNRYLGIGQENGGAFFAPNPRQQARWSACCEAVETCGRHTAARAAMQKAAETTMRAFACWMEADVVT